MAATVASLIIHQIQREPLMLVTDACYYHRPSVGGVCTAPGAGHLQSTCSQTLVATHACCLIHNTLSTPTV